VRPGSRRGAQGLVVAAGIEGEGTEQAAVVGQDANVLVGHEQGDALVLVGGAEADVVDAAEVAEGDPAALVDAVVTDPVMGR